MLIFYAVIYVCRNVKDTAVSFYHHMHVFMYAIKASFPEYASYFKDGLFQFGNYFDHLKVSAFNCLCKLLTVCLHLHIHQDAWQYKDHKNFKFMWYEDMKGNLPEVISELCDFTGCQLSPEKRSALAEHVSIDNMRKIAKESDFVPGAGEKFFRKGKVGEGKEYLEGEMLAEWNKWIKESLDGTGIVMPNENH